MKIAHPRQRRDRRHHRLRSSRRRPRGHGRRPAARPGAGDQLRQRRRGLARLLGALGRRPASRSRRSSGCSCSTARWSSGRTSTRPWSRWGLAHAAQLHRGALRGQQGPHGAAGRVQPRLPARAARATTGIAYDERTQGTLQLFRTQKQLDGTAADIAILRRFGVRLRGARPRRLHPPRAGARRGARQVRRRPAPARRRDRRLLQVHRRPWPRSPQRAASRSATARRSTRLVRDGGRIAGVATDAGRARRRRLRRRARQLFAAAARSRSASACRSTRSRATRSPCRSPTRPARPNRR